VVRWQLTCPRCARCSARRASGRHLRVERALRCVGGPTARGNGRPLPHSRPEPAVGSPRPGPAAAGTIVLGPTPGKP
jgi:hypothetical protein